jgi:hypothetical protein
MNEDGRLLEWLNTRANSPVSSLADPKVSREICYFLVNLAGKPELAAKIEIGKTPFERSANFQLAKSLLGILDRPFPFALARLVECDPAEVGALLQGIADLDPPSGDGDFFSLDDLMDILQDSLMQKLGDAEAFQTELDAIARERDFYYDKLRRMWHATTAYPPELVASLQKCLQNKPTDWG